MDYDNKIKYDVDIYKEPTTFSAQFAVGRTGSALGIDTDTLLSICFDRFLNDISIWEIAHEYDMPYSVVFSLLADITLKWHIDPHKPEHKKQLAEFSWKRLPVGGALYYVSNTGVFINQATYKVVPWRVLDPEMGTFYVSLGFAEAPKQFDVVSILYKLFWSDNYDKYHMSEYMVDTKRTYTLDIDAHRFGTCRIMLTEFEEGIIREMYGSLGDTGLVAAKTGYDISAIQRAIGPAFDPSIAGEEWAALYDNEDEYLISTFGRFQDRKTGVVFQGTYSFEGTLQVILTPPGKPTVTDKQTLMSDNPELVIKLVPELLWLTFNGPLPVEPNAYIAVKDGKQDVVHLDNLEVANYLDDFDLDF